MKGFLLVLGMTFVIGLTCGEDLSETAHDVRFTRDICNVSNGQVHRVGTAGGNCGILNNYRVRDRRQKYSMQNVDAAIVNNYRPDEIQVVGHMQANRVNNVGESGLLKGAVGQVQNGIYGNGLDQSQVSQSDTQVDISQPVYAQRMKPSDGFPPGPAIVNYYAPAVQ